jgi:Fur family ferric uptake transcriptional regulator
MSCVATLKDMGLRLTPQRRLIVDIIHNTSHHLTAEEIIDNVQSKMPGINKSTIYRTLELLEEIGCVYKSVLGDRFIYHHATEGHHHHLVCRKCGKIIDLDETLFGPMEQSLLDKYGFSVNLKHLILNGLCKECRSKTE